MKFRVHAPTTACESTLQICFVSIVPAFLGEKERSALTPILRRVTNITRDIRDSPREVDFLLRLRETGIQ